MSLRESQTVTLLKTCFKLIKILSYIQTVSDLHQILSEVVQHSNSPQAPIAKSYALWWKTQRKITVQREVWKDMKNRQLIHQTQNHIYTREACRWPPNIQTLKSILWATPHKHITCMWSSVSKISTTWMFSGT